MTEIDEQHRPDRTPAAAGAAGRRAGSVRRMLPTALAGAVLGAVLGSPTLTSLAIGLAAVSLVAAAFSDHR